MNCPQCKKQMEKGTFFSINTLFGGLHFRSAGSFSNCSSNDSRNHRLVYNIGFDNISGCFMLGKALV